MTEAREFTYEVTHPRLSEPLVMESHVERRPASVAAWATLYILQYHDEMIPMDEFVVRLVE